MNYSDRTERVHTFADVPRIEITRHRIAGLDSWDTEDRTTVQPSADPVSYTPLPLPTSDLV